MLGPSFSPSIARFRGRPAATADTSDGRPCAPDERAADPGTVPNPPASGAAGYRPRAVARAQRRRSRSSSPMQARVPRASSHRAPSTRIAAVTRAPSWCTPDRAATVTAPPAHASYLEDVTQRDVPAHQQPEIPGSRSETRVTRPRWPGRSEPSSGSVLPLPARPWRGWDRRADRSGGRPAGPLSHRTARREACFSTASSWTLSQESPSIWARKASSSRCRRTPMLSAACWPR